MSATSENLQEMFYEIWEYEIQYQNQACDADDYLIPELLPFEQKNRDFE